LENVFFRGADGFLGGGEVALFTSQNSCDWMYKYIVYLVECANLVRAECTHYSVKDTAVVEEDKVVLFPAEDTAL
jgi:hypothetical protein